MTAPAVTPDPLPTLGDLLVELLAAFTTSNANQAELLDRVEKLEARFTDECPCNNDVFGEGPCRDCRAAFAKRES